VTCDGCVDEEFEKREEYGKGKTDEKIVHFSKLFYL